MALHDLDQVGVRRSLQLVFGDFLDALDEVGTRGAIEEGLRIVSPSFRYATMSALLTNTGRRLKRVEGRIDWR